MTPSGMIAIRYTGDSRRSEAPITGKGKEWWPGELRCVPLARGSQLLAAGLGWERDEDEDDLVAVTAAQTSAGAVGVAGVTATGGMVGPDGAPVSGGGAGVYVPDVATLSPGWAAWHNGGANYMYPSDSLSGTAAAAAAGSALTVADMDLRVTADGVIYGMHSNTLDETTNLTGSSLTVTWADLRAGVIDCSSWFAAGYPNEQIPTFGEFVRLCRGKVVMMPEIKNGAPYIVQAALAAGLTSKEIVFASFTLSDLTTYVIPAGYKACFITDVLTSPPAWSTLKAAGVDYCQYKYTSYAVDAPVIAQAKAAGIACIAYTLSRRSDFAAAIASGAVGVYSDDPIYCQSTGMLYNADTWVNQRWMPGMIPQEDFYRGSFPVTGVWQQDTTAASPAGYRGVLLGWAECGPKLGIEFELSFEAVTSDTRWIGVFINAVDDRLYDDSAANTASGYHCLVRRSGTLDVYRKDAGAATTQLVTQAGSTITLSTYKRIRITRDATSITVSNLTDSVVAAVSIGGSPYAGKSIHIGTSGARCRVRNFAVKPLA